MTVPFDIPPGEALAESLQAFGMSQIKLAERTGLSRKTINGIVNRRERMTATSALPLEKDFLVPDRIRIALQRCYEQRD